MRITNPFAEEMDTRAVKTESSQPCNVFEQPRIKQ
jgi:hypothetical protein